MKTTLLSLVAFAGLLATTSVADARPPRFSNNFPAGVGTYPTYNPSAYSRSFSYYPTYYNPYYFRPNPVYSFNFGTGYTYPTWYYGSGYYPRPYSYGAYWWRSW
jgi:hypothetical protein